MLFCTFTATLLVNAEGSVNGLPQTEYVFYPEVIEDELVEIEPPYKYIEPTATPEPTIVMPLWSEPEHTVPVPIRSPNNMERLEYTAPKVPVTGVNGEVTHYGTSYNGNTMGCGAVARSREFSGYGDGIYRSQDPSIAASAYDLASGSRPYACGAVLLLSGPAGNISVVVQDACPGCGWNHLDLSEEGITRVCGGLGRCQVRIDIK